jgi:hypothetical protein
MAAVVSVVCMSARGIQLLPSERMSGRGGQLLPFEPISLSDIEHRQTRILATESKVVCEPTSVVLLSTDT